MYKKWICLYKDLVHSHSPNILTARDEALPVTQKYPIWEQLYLNLYFYTNCNN